MIRAGSRTPPIKNRGGPTDTSRVIRRVAVAATVVVFGATLTGAARAATPVPGAPSCPVFPADNWWNADISASPVNSHSAAWLASTNASTTHLHPDFGSSGDPAHPYGIPYAVVDGSHAKVNVTFDYSTESDHVPYPLGPDIPIESGSDAHAVVVDSSTCRLYETFATRQVNGGWAAGSGAVWDLKSNALRPNTWTSGDAAGLPILPGLLRLDEVQQGFVSHAIRFTVAKSSRAHLWPARHDAGSTSDPNVAPMGARFRLQAGFDISHFRPDTQVVLRAMQHYGLVVADNGSNWFFQGAATNAWPDAFISELKTIPASAFEAIDTSALQVGPDSGQVANADVTVPPPPPPPHGSSGYWIVDDVGKVTNFGSVPFAGYASMSPTVHIEGTPSGAGYWTVTSWGHVRAFGDAVMLGELPALSSGETVVSMSRTATGRGYWLFTNGGKAFPYGDAPTIPDARAIALNAPILDSVATPSGRGYYLIAGDGGVFCFGDAQFHGSMGGHPLNAPVQSLVPTPDGLGYWLVAADGGVFSFGAPFRGSMGGHPLNKPVSGMVAYGDGYLMVAQDGGVFDFSNLAFNGSLGGSILAHPIVSVAGWSG